MLCSLVVNAVESFDGWSIFPRSGRSNLFNRRLSRSARFAGSGRRTRCFFMATRFNERVKVRWLQLILHFGGKCEVCEVNYDLEFAHVKPTDCRGKGRGKYRRLRDILRHPSHYRLLCMNCHDDFDGRTRRKRQPDYIRRTEA